MFTANSWFQLLLKHNKITCAVERLSTILALLENGPIKVPKQRQNHSVWRRSTFNFGRDEDALHFHASKCGCKFIVVQPSVIACENPLQKSLSFITILLQILCTFSIVPFLLIMELLWHTPYPNVVMDDELCRFIADIQLSVCICYSNRSLFLKQNINS